MGISLNVLNWSPVIEGQKAVLFVTTAMACVECAAVVINASNVLNLDEDQEIANGEIGNIHWRTKGLDVADHCDLCQEGGYGRQIYEELRFWVEVGGVS